MSTQPMFAGLSPLQQTTFATKLFAAINDGNIPLSTTLLEIYSDGAEEVRDQHGNTIVHHAAVGKIKMLEFALRFRALKNVQNARGMTALHLTIEDRRHDASEILLSHGASFIIPNARGETALITASMEGLIELIAKMRISSEDVNISDNSGWTSLMWAAQRGFIDVVLFLLEKGAKVNERSENHLTALMIASEYGHLNIVKELEKHGANRNDLAPIASFNFMPANAPDDEDTIQFTGNASRDVDLSVGNNSLHIASKYGRHHVVAYFLEPLDGKEVDINQLNENGMNAVMLATQGGYEKTLEILTTHNDHIANLEQRNNSKLTALQMAIKKGFSRSALILLNAGAEKGNEMGENDSLQALREEAGGREISPFTHYERHTA